MDKIFVVVFHLFSGGQPTDGNIHSFMPVPSFKTEASCRAWLDEAQRTFDLDKVIQRNFYVDCMDLSKVPSDTPMQ